MSRSEKTIKVNRVSSQLINLQNWILSINVQWIYYHQKKNFCFLASREENFVFIKALERFPCKHPCQCFMFWLVEHLINWLLKLHSLEINELSFSLLHLQKALKYMHSQHSTKKKWSFDLHRTRRKHAQENNNTLECALSWFLSLITAQSIS